MSPFDSITSAIDKTAGSLDKASNILGDNAPGGAAASDSAVKYYQGDWIGKAPGGVGASTAPYDLRVQDSGKIVELIHYGWVHGDYCTNFPHGSLPDDGDAKLPQDPPMPGSRAIMYRAALEREALLLGGFVASTQQVLMDKEQAESGSTDPTAALANASGGSAFGAVAGVAGDLLGGGGSNSAGSAKAADFSGVNDKVKGVGGAVNTASPTYTITHQAGKDLHQARANYRAALDKVRNPPPANPQSGLLSSISSVASMVGPAGDILNLVEGIYTKVFDLYVGVYAELAAGNELAIEKACHDMSLAAIQQNKMPIFAPWFIKGDAADSSSSSSDDPSQAPPLLAMGTGQQNNLGDQLQKMPGKMKDAGQDAAEKGLSDLLDVDTDNYFGSAFVTQAMAVMPPKPAKDQPKPPETPVGDVVGQTFEKVLGVPISIAKDIIAQIMQTDSEFLEAIFSKLIAMDPSKTIAQADLYAVARKRLLQKLLDILVSKLQFLQNAEKSVDDFSLLKSSDGSKDVKGDQALKKGGSMAMDELTDKLGVALDPILQFAMGDLAGKLDGFRSTAVAQKAMTMEVYLGRLPYLRALLFRNTFFPIWDLLIQQVFGKASGPIQSFMNCSKGFLNTAKGPLDSVRDVAGKAKSVNDEFGRQNHQVGVGTSGNAQNYVNAWDQGGASNTSKDSTVPKIEQDFPIQGRLNTASADPITQDEWLKIQMIADALFTGFPPDITAKPAPPSPPTPAPANPASWF